MVVLCRLNRNCISGSFFRRNIFFRFYSRPTASAASFPTGIFKMMGQIFFPQRNIYIASLPCFCIFLKGNDYIRNYSCRLDRPSLGCIIAGRGQPYTCSVGQRDHGLHRAFPESPGTENNRSCIILQGTGNDLRSRGRAPAPARCRSASAFGHAWSGSQGIP